jgi:methyl-accepting chemotaxis protein
VDEAVSEEIEKVVGDAPEAYNTLGEVVDYMQEHVAEAESRNERIEENTDAIKDINEKLTTIDPTGSGWNEVS